MANKQKNTDWNQPASWWLKQTLTAVLLRCVVYEFTAYFYHPKNNIVNRPFIYVDKGRSHCTYQLSLKYNSILIH